MNKKLVVALAVWAVALGASGALAYTLNSPIHPGTPGVSSVLERPLLRLPSTVEAAADVSPDSQSPSMVLPTVFIKVRRGLIHAPPTVQVRDLACGPWQTMEQGAATQMVRHCE